MGERFSAMAARRRSEKRVDIVRVYSLSRSTGR
jgi:hypothetical protein